MTHPAAERTTTQPKSAAHQRPLRLLVIDDDPAQHELVRLMLARHTGPLQVDGVGGYNEGLRLALTGAYDLCLVDYRLDDQSSGMDLIRAVRTQAPDLPLILLTGDSSEEVEQEGIDAGASDQLVKGRFDRALLERTIRYALERERMGRKLRESEHRLRTVLAAAPVIIYSFGRDGRITFIEGRGLASVGVTTDELIGRSVFELLLERPEVLSSIRRSLAGEPVVERLEVGDQVLECRTTPILEPDGQVASCIGVCTDITHLVRAEEQRLELVRQLESERGRLDDLIESLPGAVWESVLSDDDRELRMTFVSDYIETLLGYTAEEWLSNPDFWLSRVHPEDLPRIEVPSVALAESDHASTRTHRMIARDGHVVWIDVRFSVVYDESGKPVGLRGIVLDVTEQKYAEERHAAISDLNRSIVESVKAHIAVIEPDGAILLVNDSWMQFAVHFDPETAGAWAPGGNYVRLLAEAIERGRLDASHVLDGAVAVLDRRLDSFSAEYSVETSLGPHTFQVSITPLQGSGGAVVVRHDVTDERNAEHARHASQMLFESFMDHSPALAFIKDAQGRYLYVNEPLARAVGRTRQSVVGCTDVEVWPRHIADQFVRHDREVLQREGPLFFEETIALGGVDRIFHAIRFPMRDASGDLLVCGEAHDITDQRHTLESLRKSEERFRLTAQATSDIVYDWDMATQTIWWNENLEKLLGHVDDGKCDLDWWESQVHEEDAEETIRCLFEAIGERAHHWNAEYRFRRADGSFANLYERGYILYDGDGTASRMIGAIVDNTQQRSAAEALRRSEEEYRRIVETAQEGIWVTDQHGVTKFVNATMARMLGLSTSEMLGRRFAEFLDQLSLEFARGNEDRRRQGFSDRYDIQLLRTEGEPIWVLVSASPILDADGDLAGSLAMVTDITARKEVETALRSARDDLELRVGERTAELAAAMRRLQQANLAQRRFVADASHDLRTPLTVIRAELDLLLRAGVKDKRTQASLERTLAEARRLDQIATDMLTLATLDAQNPEDRLELIRLDEMLLESVSHLTSLARQRRITWAITIDDALEVRGSRLGLERAIANVLDNALKYSPDGSSIAVSLAREQDRGVIVVQDRGIGIPEEDLTKVFERFYRSDAARSTPGTGLGLSIVRTVVECHGGRVDIESAPGEGTTVTLRLPTPSCTA